MSGLGVVTPGRVVVVVVMLGLGVVTLGRVVVVVLSGLCVVTPGLITSLSSSQIDLADAESGDA